MPPKFGATGKFPDGKIGPDDEGELTLGVVRDSQGRVHVNFGKPVQWLAMPPEKAIELANMLREAAGVS